MRGSEVWFKMMQNKRRKITTNQVLLEKINRS